MTSVIFNTPGATTTGSTLEIGKGINERAVNLVNAFEVSDDAQANGLNYSKFIYAETSAPTGSFSYLTYGNWFECSRCDTETEVIVEGAYVYGLATHPNNIPTIGKATYLGSITGIFTDKLSNITLNTKADLNASVDFSARTVNFITTNTSWVGLTPALDMAATLSYNAGVNEFSGPVVSTLLNGTATGKFFGPDAKELGGVYTLQGAAGNHDGAFVGKNFQ